MWVEEGKFYDFNKFFFLFGDIFFLLDILLVNINDFVEIG